MALAEMNSPFCKEQRRNSAKAEVHFTKTPALQLLSAYSHKGGISSLAITAQTQNGNSSS